jgi:hypothetical protein
VVGVGVEDGDDEGHLAAVEADELPVEVGGELERQVGQRGFAVVAEGEQGADGEMALGGAEMDVEVEIGAGGGGALGVFRGGLRGDFGRLWSCRVWLGCTVDGFAVFVEGALEDDLALFVLILLGLLEGLRGDGRRAGGGLGVSCQGQGQNGD